MANNKIVDLEVLKAFREKTDEKYVIEGEYSPNTRVGNADEADNLTPYGENSGASDDTPFVMQTTGGQSDVGALAYLRALRGNSVAFNQIFANTGSVRTDFAGATGSFDATNGTFTINGTTNTTLSNGWLFSNNKIITTHNFLFKVKLISGSVNASNKTTSLNANGLAIGMRNHVGSLIGDKNRLAQVGDANEGITKQGTYNATYFGATVDSGVVFTNAVFQFQVFDLNLLGKEYDSVLDFNRDYPLPHYAYNAGQLFSCKASKIRNTGFNQCDEVFEGGTIDGSGQNSSGINSFRTKNYIEVIAGETYCIHANNFLSVASFVICEYDANNSFILYTAKYSNNSTITLQSNTKYIRLAFYKSSSDWGTSVPTKEQAQVCINLHWAGERDGEYEPYKEPKECNLPSVELRSAGNVYDELTPDGTLIRRVGVVDLGTLNWEQLASGSRVYFRVNVVGIKTATSTNTKGNLNCALYQIGTYEEVRQESSTKDKVVGVSTSTNIAIYDSSKASLTAEQFKTAMSGIYLFYELAEYTSEQNDAYKYQESQEVDDFGTQEFVSAFTESASNPIVPQGNDFFYPVDYKAFIDSLGGREDIEYDASQIVSQAELEVVDDKHDALYDIVKENLGGALRHQISGVDFNNTAWLDLGNGTWEALGSSRFVCDTFSSLIKAVASTSDVAKIVCSIYQTVSYSNLNTDICVAIYTNGKIYIKDTNKTALTSSEFKTAMKGILLAYEKA